MRERVLITGASGFLGYHLIEEALKNNLDVYAAVRKSSNTDHLKNLNIQFTTLHFTDIASLSQEIKEKRYDYIIHAAGLTRARTPKEFATVNAYYTYNLAKAAEDSGIKKFVFVSSLAAIGPLKNINGLITEHTPAAPVSLYGKSKLLAEQKITTLTGLNYTILRPCAVYGPRDTGLFTFIKQLAKGLEPYVGNVKQKLSFVYAKDLASATIKALYTADKGVYNICDGNFYTRYEFADSVKGILNLRSYKFHLPVIFVKIVAGLIGKMSSLRGNAPMFTTDKIDELTAANWHCDIAKAQGELGYYPRYNLYTGLAETMAWYKQNNWL